MPVGWTQKLTDQATNSKAIVEISPLSPFSYLIEKTSKYQDWTPLPTQFLVSHADEKSLRIAQDQLSRAGILMLPRLARPPHKEMVNGQWNVFPA